jgi:hypothetical protein
MTILHYEHPVNSADVLFLVGVTSTQGIPPNSNTKITSGWGTPSVTLGPGGAANWNAATGVYTIPVRGLYRVAFQSCIACSQAYAAQAAWGASIYYNTSTVWASASQFTVNITVAVNVTPSVNRIGGFNAGDTLDFRTGNPHPSYAFSLAGYQMWAEIQQLPFPY